MRLPPNTRAPAAPGASAANVYMPKDRVTNQHMGYGFVEFKSEEDADYAIKVLNMVKLHGKPLRVNKSAQDRAALEVGANLFIGNLDPDVDETVSTEALQSVLLGRTTKKNNKNTAVSDIMHRFCNPTANADSNPPLPARAVAVQHLQRLWRGGQQSQSHARPRVWHLQGFWIRQF